MSQLEGTKFKNILNDTIIQNPKKLTVSQFDDRNEINKNCFK